MKPASRDWIAQLDLRPDHLDVVHAGKDSISMGPRTIAVAAARLLDDLEPL